MSRRRRGVIIGVAVLVVLGLVGGMAIFQPWKLFVDQHVDEAGPTIGAAPQTTTPTPGSGGDDEEESQPSPTPMADEPRVLRRGELISHEHPTTGTVALIEQPDGDLVLRIEDLDTSNGPDLRVWLSAAPVIEGRDGWFVFADHPHLELGPLKGNQGSQNYPVPAGTSVDEFTALSIWCVRFSVSFGAAELT